MRTLAGSIVSLLAMGLVAVRGAGAQSPQAAIVPVQRSHTALLIVEVRINGAGPYQFVLDTGTNITLLESSLFHELRLEPRGRPDANVVGAMRLGSFAFAQEISIGSGVSQRGVAVLEVEGNKRSDLGPSVRGVLGENFLRAFDLLIDNRLHQVVFDSGESLAASLTGEHLPVSLFASVHGASVPDHPVVAVGIPSFEPRRSLRLVVDTASEGVNLLPRPGGTPQQATAPMGRRAQFSLLDGAVCAHWTGPMQLGLTTTGKVKITSCGKPGRLDGDGELPTFLFDRVFISHRRGYLILNPVGAEE